LRDALAALFERPRERHFERALAATADAIAQVQQLMAGFTPSREERHQLLRILSQLHFIRTALLDPQSPLASAIGARAHISEEEGAPHAA
ncbi:FUSC family protein, partial [Paraburkholderia sp. BR14320]